MIRTAGITQSRSWTIFRRRRNAPVVTPRDEAVEAEARRQLQARMEAHREAVRAALIYNGTWYF